MYAIVETGGKQYRVVPGQVMRVEKLDAQPGDVVELDRVLLFVDGENIEVGQPTVPGAKVVGKVVAQGKARKVIVFKYKPKVRYRKKTGHRQSLTTLSVTEIVR